MRVAETRAVNRALRKAYGIGICSVEEIGSLTEPSTSSSQSKKLPLQPTNGNYGGRTVRDHLCQIIRQHQFDPTLVKSYATDFCGVKSFVKQLVRCRIRRPPSRLGQKDRRCPAVPTQRLSRSERRCRVRRQITGLHAADRCAADQIPDGLFLVRIQRVQFRRHAQKPYYTLAMAILEPRRLPTTSFPAGSTAARRPCGS